MNAASAAQRELVGTIIGDRFEVLAFARAGGMGHVYRARDRANDGAIVALKVLAPETGDAERFAREAALLAKVDHPGVVRYVDHGPLGEREQYLAMEWLDGEDLADRLGAAGTLSVDDALTIAQKTTEALVAAHRAGIIHRDLKPANIFLVGGHIDAVKVLDFGIARAAASSDITVTGTVLGTPAYMAPEQVRGEPIDKSADVYGIGALLFRCLAGRAPFQGTHQLAVLAKVIIEPPALLRDVRPDVPAPVSDLVARLLAKEPSARPPDGEALREELESLRAGAENLSERRIQAAISAREQRVACVVLCATGATPQEATVAEDSASRTEDEIRSAVLTRGGVLDRIAKGASVVTIPHAASASEQAARAAHCALALAALRPGTPLFVATGRVIVTGEGRVGEVIDRAAAALIGARKDERGGVFVDGATAELLEGRFLLEGEGEWRELVSEIEDATPIRTLLGRPAPCIGRETQLAMLDAMLTACVDDARAGAALVVAEPGLGKTHLVNELLRPARGKHPALDVLFAKGDPIRAASAFGIALSIIARAAGIRDADSQAKRAAKLSALVESDFGPDERPRMRELLGEIGGVPTPAHEASAELRAARADATVMADALREAWAAWMTARAERAPVLVLLEDVQWADAASIRLLEATIEDLSERPLFILATSRPEGTSTFAERWKSRGLVEITLGPLGKGAAERLVKSALGADVDPSIVAAICKRAAGHPYHLEELVRAVADGRGADALPDSILGMVQARLDGLGAGPRRLLRAASVFGETFRPKGLLALMGDEMTEHEVRGALADLARQEMVSEERTKQGESVHRFRHMLLRDAAYATLAEVDRVRAHRRAAEWLERSGELDPAVLGEHYARGDVPDRAAEFFRRAAAQAIARGDFERAHAHAERGLALAPTAATEAALFGIQAEILYWRGEIAVAAERAPSAVARLTRGAPEWFDAVSVAVGALGQLGRNDEVAALLRDAAHLESPAEGRGAHVVALCRGLTQLFWAHAGAGLADVRARLDALVARPEPLDAYQMGWVHRVRGESAWLYDKNVARCLADLDASSAAFERARAIRPLCLSRLNAASLTGWSGNPARGLELVRSARADAERLGAGFLLKYGHAVEGLLLAYARDPSAADVMAKALEGLRGSPRLAFICHIVLGSLALDRGDIAAGDDHANAASAISVVDDLRAAAFALSSRVALARGQLDEAERLGEAGVKIAVSCTDLELTFGMAGVALAEVHVARGRLDLANEVLARIIRITDEICATIPNEEHRARFRERPMANDRLAKLHLHLLPRQA